MRDLLLYHFASSIATSASSDPCAGAATYCPHRIIAPLMAIDPSTKNNVQSQRHVRNVTPVIPVLPLPVSDKKWRKPSQTANEIAESVASVQSADHDRSYRSSPESKEVVKGPQDVPRAELDPLRTGEPKPIESDVADGPVDLPVARDEYTHGITQAEVLEPFESAADTGLLEVYGGSRTRSRSSTLIAHEVGELAETSPPIYRDRSFEITLGFETPSEPNHPVAPETARVQPSEGTQGSDPDNTSIQRSNTTGLTDYGSTVGESNLETVIRSQQPTKHPQIPHRQSEVAPELLSNGYSPNSSRTDKISHQMNASVSSQSPRLPSLQDHLLFLATTKQACDLVIQLNQPDPTYRPSMHDVHALFLMRSPRLAPLIAELDQTKSKKVVPLYPVRNIFPHAFDAALRFFYSDQTLTADTLLSPQILGDKQAKAHSLDYIMSYWIAGVELGLDPVKARAYDFFQQIVAWDTAELIVKEIRGLRYAEEVLSNSQDKFEIRGIAETLLSLLTQLFVEGLNMQAFGLDAGAQVTAFPTRLSHLESRPNNPALSSMVFGSLPAQAMPTPSNESIASGILLNIDFNELQLLVSELVTWHGALAQNVLRYAVHLREERREQIVANPAIPNKDRLNHSAAWDVAGWREHIHDGRLHRERVGFLLPNCNP